MHTKPSRGMSALVTAGLSLLYGQGLGEVKHTAWTEAGGVKGT